MSCWAGGMHGSVEISVTDKEESCPWGTAGLGLWKCCRESPAQISHFLRKFLNAHLLPSVCADALCVPCSPLCVRRCCVGPLLSPLCVRMLCGSLALPSVCTHALWVPCSVIFSTECFCFATNRGSSQPSELHVPKFVRSLQPLGLIPRFQEGCQLACIRAIPA